MFGMLTKSYGFWVLITSICYILLEIGVSHPTYSVVDYVEFVILGIAFFCSLCLIIFEIIKYKKGGK